MTNLRTTFPILLVTGPSIVVVPRVCAQSVGQALLAVTEHAARRKRRIDSAAGLVLPLSRLASVGVVASRRRQGSQAGDGQQAVQHIEEAC